MSGLLSNLSRVDEQITEVIQSWADRAGLYWTVRLRILSVNATGRHTNLSILLTTGEKAYLVWARVSAAESDHSHTKPTATILGESIVKGIARLLNSPSLLFWRDGYVRVAESFN